MLKVEGWAGVWSLRLIHSFEQWHLPWRVKLIIENDGSGDQSHVAKKTAPILFKWSFSRNKADILVLNFHGPIQHSMQVARIISYYGLATPLLSSLFFEWNFSPHVMKKNYNIFFFFQSDWTNTYRHLMRLSGDDGRKKRRIKSTIAKNRTAVKREIDFFPNGWFLLNSCHFLCSFTWRRSCL